MSKPKDLILSDNPTSEEITPIVSPSVGSFEEVLSEKMPKKIAQVEDISDEINSKIKESAKKEADQKKKDEDLNIQEDLYEFEIEEMHEPRANKLLYLIGGLLVCGVGYFAVKKGKKDQIKHDQNINDTLAGGLDNSVKVDLKSGMVY